eukprot:sb/3472990/
MILLVVAEDLALFLWPLCSPLLYGLNLCFPLGLFGWRSFCFVQTRGESVEHGKISPPILFFNCLSAPQEAFNWGSPPLEFFNLLYPEFDGSTCVWSSFGCALGIRYVGCSRLPKKVGMLVGATVRPMLNALVLLIEGNENIYGQCSDSGDRKIYKERF